MNDSFTVVAQHGPGKYDFSANDDGISLKAPSQGITGGGRSLNNYFWDPQLPRVPEEPEIINEHLNTLLTEREYKKFEELKNKYPDFRPSIKNFQFNHEVLSMVDFENCDFENCDFKACHINNASFKNSSLKNVTFTDCCIKQSNFNNTEIDNLVFSAEEGIGIIAHNLQFQDAQVNNLDASNIDTNDFNFHGATLSGDFHFGSMDRLQGNGHGFTSADLSKVHSMTTSKKLVALNELGNATPKNGILLRPDASFEFTSLA